MNILDRTPPEALLSDELIGTFGQREQEIAVMAIIEKACLHRSWKIPLVKKDFEDFDTRRGSSLAVDGFQYLYDNDWIEPTRVIGEFSIKTALIQRLMRERPGAFE